MEKGNFEDLIRIYKLTKIGTEKCHECEGTMTVYEQDNTGGVIIGYCDECGITEGDVVETNYTEFKKLEKNYYLEEVCDEECPMCGGTLTFYESKYIDGASVRFCFRCEELENDISVEANQDNICEICEEIVAYEDDDFNDYISCSCCGKKVHLSCVNELLCNRCNVWVCEEHLLEKYDEYLRCYNCEVIHEIDCINNETKYLDEESERLCDKCYEREQDIISEVKSTVNDKNILENIESNKMFYVTEARNNQDLTIMLTHLVKGDNSYEVLKNILNDKKLVAAPTGYYKHLNDTKSVCFADLTTKGLLRHSKKYSVYGLAFLKEVIFKRGGGPVLYINDKYLSGATISDEIKPFINKINLDNYDFHHEREWRIPSDFNFILSEIAVLYAPTKHHQEIRRLYPEIKNILDIDLLQLI